MVAPAITRLPSASRAIADARSGFMPPQYVRKFQALPAGLRQPTRASSLPPYAAWRALYVRKPAELVAPATQAAPAEVTAIPPSESNPLPPTSVAYTSAGV